MARLSIRIYFDGPAPLGRGKAQLLELVGETGSIRKAAIAMKMSYRRAWLLLQETEQIFGAPPVETATGGKSGGGAKLTALGRAIVRHYRAIERKAAEAGAGDLAALARRAKPQRRRTKP